MKKMVFGIIAMHLSTSLCVIARGNEIGARGRVGSAWDIFHSEKAIERELSERKRTYQARFRQLVPDNKLCSDLELLLILERAIETNDAELMNAPCITGETNEAIKDGLEEVRAEYRQKFGGHPPWWWICSDEERLMRMEDAIKTDKYHPYYFTGEEAEPIWYELGKIMAEYERRFRRLPPEWQGSDEEYLWRLQRMLGRPSPYLTEEEKTKLKIEYEEKFGIHMTDFELAIANVSHSGNAIHSSSFSISVTRTATGGLARYLYSPSGRLRPDILLEWLEKRGDCEEWLAFINALYKLHFTEWDERYRNPGYLGGFRWSFRVEFLGKNNLHYVGVNAYPPNWQEFGEIFSDMISKINKRVINETETQLRTEYERKFEKSITDLELSTSRVDFLIVKPDSVCTWIRVNRRMVPGALASLVPCRYGEMLHTQRQRDEATKTIELDISEWLDYISVLFKHQPDMWRESYSLKVDDAMRWSLNVFTSAPYNPSFSIQSSDSYPPNWSEIIKTIDVMRAKIEKEGIGIIRGSAFN